jgi:hypothetical protein
VVVGPHCIWRSLGLAGFPRMFNTCVFYSYNTWANR